MSYNRRLDSTSSFRNRLNYRFGQMDKDAGRRKRALNPPTPQKGPRALFLEELDKGSFESAKKLIQSKYGSNAFPDEMLREWEKESREKNEGR